MAVVFDAVVPTGSKLPSSCFIPSPKQIIVFVVLILIFQRVGFALLGPGHAGTLFVNCLEIAANILAIGCSIATSRRGRGMARIFWLLFGSAFALQLVADVGWAYCRYFNISVAEDALFPSLFFRLYAVPIGIILFLSDDVRTSRLETFLDSCIVVGLLGLGMYQVQMAELKAHDPNIWRLITTSTVVNVTLILAAGIRAIFSSSDRTRGLFTRLTIYISVYSSIAFLTSYVDAYFPSIDRSFDLIWIVAYLTAAILAITWRSPAETLNTSTKPRIGRRTALLCFNLSMAIMVLGSAVLGLRQIEASRIVGLTAVSLVLFSYAVRCALMQDVREKYVAALQESNTRYECVAMATNDILWERNLADETLILNRDSPFGYRREDVPGKREWWISNVHPEDRQRILASVNSLLASDRNSWSGEYRFKRSDGSYAFVLDRCYVVRDQCGKPVRMIGSLQDQTVRKQAELDIQQAHQAAEAAARAKSEFLSNMSHEIRTPLNGILGMLELAGQTKLNPEQKDLLTLAGESAGVLLSVVNDVLDFSKIEAGKIELEKTEFDVADIIAESARTVMVSAHRKKLELLYSVAADVPACVIGDSSRLKQVLINLLGNAVKFTEHGEIILRVDVEARKAGEVDLRFAVSDTGIGIPKEKQTTIFHAFSQADNSVTRLFGGTGLGLTISAKVVNLMQGKIWVESEPGKGSTFLFTAKFALAPVAASSHEPALASRLPGVRVLVAAAHPATRAFLQEILTASGAKITAVRTAAEGFAMMKRALSKSQAFHVLLSDCWLPDADGFTLIEQAKRNPEPRPGFIMMLTANDYQETVARCRQVGIAAHLLKPFKRSELLSALERVLPEAKHIAADSVSSVNQAHASTRSFNILLAEDNVLNQNLAVKMLQKMGHSVEVAENGRQAVEKIKTESFDLVFMDGHMPEMDGLAATRSIREWERVCGTHIPIIAMTAMAMAGDREACEMAGMDAFIAKPISMNALKETIDQVMAASTLDTPCK